MRGLKRAVKGLGESHWANKRNGTFVNLPVPVTEDCDIRLRKRRAVEDIDEIDDTVVHICGPSNRPIANIGTNSEIENDNNIL